MQTLVRSFGPALHNIFLFSCGPMEKIIAQVCIILYYIKASNFYVTFNKSSENFLLLFFTRFCTVCFHIKYLGFAYRVPGMSNSRSYVGSIGEILAWNFAAGRNLVSKEIEGQ